MLRIPFISNIRTYLSRIFDQISHEEQAPSDSVAIKFVTSSFSFYCAFGKQQVPVPRSTKTSPVIRRYSRRRNNTETRRFCHVLPLRRHFDFLRSIFNEEGRLLIVTSISASFGIGMQSSLPTAAIFTF